MLPSLKFAPKLKIKIITCEIVSLIRLEIPPFTACVKDFRERAQACTNACKLPSLVRVYSLYMRYTL